MHPDVIIICCAAFLGIWIVVACVVSVVVGRSIRIADDARDAEGELVEPRSAA